MATDADPIVGQWYSHLGKGREFVVVAVDEDTGTVEIQKFDGDIEEVELNDWYGMDMELIEPPEDWTGPVDDVERDDLGLDDDTMQTEDWDAPLGEFNIETETKQKRRESEESPEDEWSERSSEEQPPDEESI